MLRPPEARFEDVEPLLPPLAATLERVVLLAEANPLLADLFDEVFFVAPFDEVFLVAPFDADFFVAPFELLLEEEPPLDEELLLEEELRPPDELFDEDLLPELLLAAFFVAFAMLMGFVRVN